MLCFSASILGFSHSTTQKVNIAVRLVYAKKLPSQVSYSESQIFPKTRHFRKILTVRNVCCVICDLYLNKLVMPFVWITVPAISSVEIRLDNEVLSVNEKKSFPRNITGIFYVIRLCKISIPTVLVLYC